MPAQSQQQQKLFGLALAVKRGEVSPSEVSDEVKDIVDRMSEKDIEDFAGTSHKGLPKKVEQQIREMVREIMRERAIAEIELSKADMEKLHSDGEVDVDGEKVTFEEGKKRFNTMYGVGSSKYVVNYHDGKNKHKDGSDFFDIKTFKNQKDFDKFQKDLLSKGFVQESVNEAASRTAMEIGGLTGLNKDAIQKFVDTHNMDIEKVYQYVKKAKLTDRLNFVTAIVGTPGNSVQKKMIKMFGESVNEIQYKDAVEKFNDELIKHPMVKKAAQHYKKTPAEIVKVLQQRLSTKGNRGGDTKEVSIDFKDTTSGITIKHKMKFNESVNEGYSTEEKRIVLMAVKKIAKYMNVDMKTAMGYVLGAGQELERDIERGKIK